MNHQYIKSLLDEQVQCFNTPEFISSDPISIPHKFKDKEDREIIGLLTATIAWGNRKSIIKSGENLIEIFGKCPFEFVMNYKESYFHYVQDFKHRTFNGFDLHFFILSLKKIYAQPGGLQNLFSSGFKKEKSAAGGIENFRKSFFYDDTQNIRTKKHVASPKKGSAAKRLNMFLRWMVRKDDKGVDFGIWQDISPSLLSCPLDVHSGNSARRIGILNRTQNDWKAVQELDRTLRKYDPKDPSKYDFALFGMGLNQL